MGKHSFIKTLYAKAKLTIEESITFKNNIYIGKLAQIVHYFFFFFLSISIYTPKSNDKNIKQKYIQQCPDDIYLVLLGGN